MTGDLELLQDYSRNKSEGAFAALVNRHLGLVYSAALRHVRSPQLAEEVAQSTFTDLARQARRLAPGTILTAWLYRVACRTAVDVVRREARRQLREQIASEMNAMNAAADDWIRIEPLLDEAMHALDDSDRAAVLLRYFENKSLREVGQTLGTSEDAAQKRVSRAVEQLREFFTKRGVTVAAGGLAMVISANAVQAAPAGLAIAISAAALAGTIIGATAIATGAKAIATTALQKSLVAVAILTAVGTGVYEARQASALRTRVNLLQQQQSPLADQIQQLQRERDAAARQLAALRDENERLGRNSAELLRLRSEITRLRTDSLELARLKAAQAGQETNALSAENQVWQAKVNRLKQSLDQKPAMKIPELQLLDGQDWLKLVKGIRLEKDEDLPEAFGRIRKYAKDKFAPILSQALRDYARANDNQAPDDLSKLQPYFQSPVEPAILARYQPLQSGDLAWDKPAVEEKAAVDPNNDSLFKVGATGSWYSYPAVGEGGSSAWGTNDISTPPPAVEIKTVNSAALDDLENSSEARALAPVLEAYKAQHGGKEPDGPADLVPYLNTPADKTNFLNLLQKAEPGLSPQETADLEKIRRDLLQK